jgi:hypothetical protein
MARKSFACMGAGTLGEGRRASDVVRPPRTSRSTLRAATRPTLPRKAVNRTNRAPVEHSDNGAYTSPQPLTVIYAGHHWRFKFRWPQLAARWKSLRPTDFGTRTHPLVYVAFGSHASYPLPCDAPEPAPLEIDGDCWQGEFRQRVLHLFSIPVPDGRRDGEKRWSMNDGDLCDQVACLSALPTTRQGALGLPSQGKPPFDGARWNAYPGLWGRAECTFGLRVLCVRSAGPPSPSFQERYEDPAAAPWGLGLATAGVGDEVRVP